MSVISRVAVGPVVVLVGAGVIEAGDDRAVAVGLGGLQPFVEVGQVDARRHGVQVLGAVDDVEVALAAGAVVFRMLVAGDGDEVRVRRLGGGPRRGEPVGVGRARRLEVGFLGVIGGDVEVVAVGLGQREVHGRRALDLLPVRLEHLGLGGVLGAVLVHVRSAATSPRRRFGLGVHPLLAVRPGEGGVGVRVAGVDVVLRRRVWRWSAAAVSCRAAATVQDAKTIPAMKGRRWGRGMRKFYPIPRRIGQRIPDVPPRLAGTNQFAAETLRPRRIK